MFKFFALTCLYSALAHGNIHYSAISSEPITLDPAIATDTVSQFFIGNSFDGLVSWTFENGIAPSIAKKWNFEPDGLTITFEINKDLRFSDGTHLTSKHIANHFMRLRKSIFKDHFSVIRKIEVTSEYTFKIHLKKKSPHFIYLLSGIQSKIVKKNNSKSIIGSGPFVPEKSGKKWFLKPNDYFTGEVPKITIDFTVLTPDEALNAKNKNQIDDLILYPGIPLEKFSDPTNLLTQNMWSTWAIALDIRHPSLIRDEIRAEIIRGLNSSEFLKIQPGNLVAYGLSPIGMPGYIESYDQTPRKFKNQTPKEIIKIHVPIEVPEFQKIKFWIESHDLRCCTLQVVGTQFTEIIQNYTNGSLGAYLLSFNPEYPDPTFIIRSLHSKSSINFLGIKDKTLDNLIEKIDNSTDQVKIANLLRQANLLLQKKNQIAPLMHARYRAWIRDCVKGISLSPISEGYFSIRNISNTCKR